MHLKIVLYVECFTLRFLEVRWYKLVTDKFNLVSSRQHYSNDGTNFLLINDLLSLENLRLNMGSDIGLTISMVGDAIEFLKLMREKIVKNHDENWLNKLPMMRQYFQQICKGNINVLFQDLRIINVTDDGLAFEELNDELLTDEDTDISANQSQLEYFDLIVVEALLTMLGVEKYLQLDDNIVWAKHDFGCMRIKSKSQVTDGSKIVFMEVGLEIFCASSYKGRHPIEIDYQEIANMILQYQQKYPFMHAETRLDSE